uniref:Uncharacterized protein n=1 Tax=Eutreptiella gymnastica TaxID=73025 RepID=A0A7S4LIU3_9EUGL
MELCLAQEVVHKNLHFCQPHADSAHTPAQWNFVIPFVQSSGEHHPDERITQFQGTFQLHVQGLCLNMPQICQIQQQVYDMPVRNILWSRKVSREHLQQTEENNDKGMPVRVISSANIPPD